MCNGTAKTTSRSRKWIYSTYVLPPFSAAVSGEWDTAVWLGDKKRIIVIRRWRKNIGPARPIWVEDNYFLIVYTNWFCFVLSHIQNMHKESITVVEIVKIPNVQLPALACAPKSGLREFSVCFRCCCVDMKNSLSIIRLIFFITAQNLYLGWSYLDNFWKFASILLTKPGYGSFLKPNFEIGVRAANYQHKTPEIYEFCSVN